jgi:hypothetical protein
MAIKSLHQYFYYHSKYLNTKRTCWIQQKEIIFFYNLYVTSAHSFLYHNFQKVNLN